MGIEKDEEAVVGDVDQILDTETPQFFKVILHNDNFTPMYFVVDILMRFFHKEQEEAEKIMMNVHKKGEAVAGIYPREIAETKVERVRQRSKEHQFPLRLSMKPMDG